MQRTMRLAGCVELSIEDVMRAFEEPGITEVMAAAMRAALQRGPVDIELAISGPEWIAHGSARASVRWEVDGRAGRAGVQFLLLRSGYAQITEVLLAIDVNDDDAHQVAVAAHRFLDALGGNLVAGHSESTRLVRQ